MSTFDNIEPSINSTLNCRQYNIIDNRDKGIKPYTPVIGDKILTLNSLLAIAVQVCPNVPNNECELFLCAMFPTSSKFLAVSGSIIMVPSTGTYRMRREKAA
jgi:hypothetical protein